LVDLTDNNKNEYNG